MKKNIYLLLVVAFLSGQAYSQKGNNQFIFGAEVGLPTGGFNNHKTGVGLFGKALLGFSDHSQLGFRAGYTAFQFEGNNSNFKSKTSVIPLTGVYRHRFAVFYLEPQAGYGIYTTTVKTQTGSTSSKTTTSNGGFTWALGAGLQISALDAGIRFQAGHPEGGTVGFFGIHAGYTFRARSN